jgi:hypothetical protein
MAQNNPQAQPPTRANLPQRRGERGLETAPPTITQRHPSMSRFPEPIPLEDPSLSARLMGSLQDYLFSEETLILVEFLLVLAIGIVGFTAAYQPILRGVIEVHHLVTQTFGILK